jgi:transcription initiation factor TFIID subunit 9B
MADKEEPEPRDAKLVKAILRSMGVQQFEPRVVNQFLEFWYRYVVDVLGDAQVYAEHAGKAALDCDDVKLAIQSRVNFTFWQPPPRETLLELAKIRNSIPLPKVIGGPGPALPPDEDILMNPNYQLEVPTRSVREFDLEDEDEDVDSESKPDSEKDVNSSQQPNAGRKQDQDGRKVSFSLSAKRPKT